MAAYYKEKGMTLYEALLKLYEKYGYYRDGVKSMTMKGLEGMARIQRIMKTFRENTPQELGGYKVVMAKDYQTQVFRNMETGEDSGSPLPVSDVLHYTLEDGTWVCIRPSGTEPKLKFYIGVKAMVCRRHRIRWTLWMRILKRRLLRLHKASKGAIS